MKNPIPPLNPGKKTTEFFSLLLLGVMIIADGTQWINVQGNLIEWFGGAVMAYIGGRSWVKVHVDRPPPSEPS